MSNSPLCINKLLEKNPVRASAPCRIDAGGTWDIKSLSLPLEIIKPVTLNMAINLRTYITLLPYNEGWVKISSDNFKTVEKYPFGKLSFNSQFGLLNAICSFYNFQGFSMIVSSDSPVKTGLGGSSTAAVAAIKAFSSVKALLGENITKHDDILHLAYHLEDAVNSGMCGLQDHGAAVFGGVNKWIWRYSRKERPFLRESILDDNGQMELSKRILLAYTGSTHISRKINRMWVENFLTGKTRSEWIEVNDIVKRLSGYIKRKKWLEASKELTNEVTLRKKITPEAFTPEIKRLINDSERTGCGARFAGAGGGGVVWAIGEIDNIEKLKDKWADILQEIKDGKVLECMIDSEGVRQEV